MISPWMQGTVFVGCVDLLTNDGVTITVNVVPDDGFLVLDDDGCLTIYMRGSSNKTSRLEDAVACAEFHLGPLNIVGAA